ncbi:hypothetical protein [Sulfitobacter pacificus]|uniref:hypothetical protein n=1 Tax=Sulfitobacter pacificus TaxID=1499314 RepID=UPI0024E12741|nr:hypothetical protein [Sulfitobacter pacificus]
MGFTFTLSIGGRKERPPVAGNACGLRERGGRLFGSDLAAMATLACQNPQKPPKSNEGEYFDAGIQIILTHREFSHGRKA